MKKLLVILFFFYINQVSVSHASSKTVQIMAYNVLYKSQATKRVLATIKISKADIVCLRELTPEFASKFNFDMGSLYKNKAFYPRRGTWGVGIASRYKMTQVKYFSLRPYRIPGLSAIIHTPDSKILVVCIHLFPPIANRNSKSFLGMIRDNRLLRIEQARNLVKRLQRVSLPVIILGDFNDWRSAESLKIFMRGGYKHSCSMGKDNGCGNTFPANRFNLPGFVEIDHILGKRIKFIRTRVLTRGGSDHYPVQAWFQVKK